MKKIFATLTMLIIATNTTCLGWEFLNIFNKNKKEIYSTVKNYTKAMKKHDVDKVKSFYHANFISTDGFGADDIENMLRKTYSSYKNIKYKTKINNLIAYDDWALIQMSDSTNAIVYSDKEEKNKNKAGKLEGKSTWNLYLKKDNNEWKIISEDILTEETSLKYGVAKKIDIDLITPIFVENGEEYDISLKINKPNNLIALASISNEEVTYPPKDYDDKFRKFPENGDLERLVKANNKNINEYGIASIGFTKVSINEEETKAKIEILGMAYIMKRINVKNDKNYLLTKGENDVER